VKHKAVFIEPMLLQRANDLPDGPEWLRELKFDGYRAVAIKSEGRILLGPDNVAPVQLRLWQCSIWTP
jgi:ATP-dependent DNA ligase